MSKLAKALTAAAGNAGGGSLYAEDVFSTYLYEGNGSTQTITNGIDLAGEGGMVWIANRDQNYVRTIYNTERGATKYLRPSLTGAESTNATTLTSFNADGFSVGSQVVVNQSGNSIVSWTFRKAEKFFDVVTWTGNGATDRTFSHNLNAYPNCVIIKRLDLSSDWWVWHSSGGYTLLNSTAASGTAGVYQSGTPTTFSIWEAFGADANINGATYVAYLFASDAGGFGDDGSENIIKCGSYTGSGGSGQEINLGFEPQWVLVKNTSRAGQNWVIVDNMRQFDNTGYGWLYPNSSAAETSGTGAVYASPTATGFKTYGNNAAFDYLTDSYIYIAIRRPMKTPESGTEVFSPVTFTGDGVSGRVIDAGFSVDTSFGLSRSTTFDNSVLDRIRGNDKFLYTVQTGAEATKARWAFDEQNGIRATTIGADGNNNGDSRIHYFFKRATGFFDVVAYTGTGVAGSTQAHNLGVVPEMMIVKRRNNTGNWTVYDASYGGQYYLRVNTDAAAALSSTIWNDTDPTSSVFTLGAGVNVNGSGSTYIAYLFATLAGVSKVGSYTGTGSNVNVDCGFSAGARFILIKRTDSTGDWYVYDSVRGIVAGNDPYLLFNSDATEVTTTDYIDPLASGFTVTSSAPAALNASGGTYIFLAIA